MKTKTRIDAAGRIVIPKELRYRYGLDTGTEVRIVPMLDGISIVPVQADRRIVRRGRIVALETENPITDIETARSEQLERKGWRKS